MLERKFLGAIPLVQHSQLTGTLYESLEPSCVARGAGMLMTQLMAKETEVVTKHREENRSLL